MDAYLSSQGSREPRPVCATSTPLSPVSLIGPPDKGLSEKFSSGGGELTVPHNSLATDQDRHVTGMSSQGNRRALVVLSQHITTRSKGNFRQPRCIQGIWYLYHEEFFRPLLVHSKHSSQDRKGPFLSSIPQNKLKDHR